MHSESCVTHVELEQTVRTWALNVDAMVEDVSFVDWIEIPIGFRCRIYGRLCGISGRQDRIHQLPGWIEEEWIFDKEI